MRTTNQTNNHPIIEPLQIFLLDLLDFLKSGDRQFTQRLTQGLRQKYLGVVPNKEALNLRRPPGPGVEVGHYLPANFVLKTQGMTRARLGLDPSGSLNQTLLKAPNLEQTIASVMRKIQGTPILCSMDIREAFFRITLAPDSTRLSHFLMNLNTKTQELTARATQDTKLVTIQSLMSIMGLLQSPDFLGLCLEDLTTEIKDTILQYFLKFVCYLDDIQTGVVAEEILELQRKVGLDAVDLNIECGDDDCCRHDDSPPIIDKNLLGGTTPPDEKKSTRHLLKGEFGKLLLHKLCLRAATLEAALINASMPSKGATTLLHQHFQHELVNEAIKKYTEVLLAGDEPEFEILSLLPPPPQFQVWEPDSAGRPRRWNKPWRRNQPEVDKQTTFTQPSLPDQEPILRMASTAEHPTESTTQSVQGATLLGYYWNLQTDCLSTNKNTKLNLYPARRGIRPSWGQISEAEDLLRLHKVKPLTHRQALECARALFDPVQAAHSSLQLLNSCIDISS